MRRLSPLGVVVMVCGMALAAAGCTDGGSGTETAAGTASSGTSANRASTQESTTTTKATGGKWVITDLGKLWKKEQSRATAINKRGQIGGQHFVVKPFSETHDVEIGSDFLWENGRMRDLGALAADAINDSGRIIGTSKTKSGIHAVVWENGSVTDLGTLEGGTGSYPSSINDRGDIAGSSETKTGDSHAVLWRGGRLIDLGTLGGAASGAAALNNRDWVVGSSATPLTDSYGEPIEHPFLWRDGTMTDLGTFGGSTALIEGGVAPAAINNRGWVVGSSATALTNYYGKTIEHAFLWRDGTMTDLSRSAGKQRESRATAINERGEIIGITSKDLSQCHHAFLWRNGTMTDLGTLAGADGCYSEPYDINDRGYVVGQASTMEEVGHAFAWHDGVMTDLGTLPGGGESRAVAINERNQIVGWADTKTGKSHAVVWTWKPAK